MPRRDSNRSAQGRGNRATRKLRARREYDLDRKVRAGKTKVVDTTQKGT